MMKKLTYFIIALFVLMLTSTLFSTTQAMAEVYPEGMISYWKFDEGSGATAMDSVGENDGALINGPVWTTGIVGGALSFDGVNDVVKIPYSDDWNTGDELTVEAWFNLNSQTYWGPIVSRDGYWCSPVWRGWILEIYQNSDDIFFAFLSDETPCHSPYYTINYGVWYHAVGVHDGSYVRLYINGQEVGTGVPVPGPDNHSDKYGITIGSDTGCFGFHVDGTIDEVAIYNRALTPEEIQQHYQNGLNGLGYEVVIPQLSCTGFEAPMDKGPVTVKKNRVLPLKAALLDSDSNPIADTDITALPVLQVFFDAGTGGDPVDVTDQALPAGQGTEGNQFVFTDEGKWQFNLKTKNYSAAGTYTITMVCGDDSEYVIDPTCTATFVIE